MDDRPEPPSPEPPSGDPRPELRELLPGLDRTLSGPALAMRDELDRIAAEAAQADSPGMGEAVQALLAQCQDLIALTQGFFALADAELGGSELHPSLTTIGGVLGQVDARFGPEARSRGLAWRCSGGEDGDRAIRVDPAACQEVVAHLVDNALKYTPRGGSVRVDAGCEGTSWRLTVVDDGPGIPESSRDQVFEAFFRLPREENAGIPGHGFGLAAARGLARRLGGDVALGSVEGPGTTILLRLPVEGPPG